MIAATAALCLMVSGGEIAAQQGKKSLLSPGNKAALVSAQEAWKAGHLKQAWSGYDGKREAFLSAVDEFDPEFGLWLMERHLEFDQTSQAEELGKRLIVWFDTHKNGITAEQRGRLALEYANIAFEKQEYARARAQYETISSNREYAGTASGVAARFRIAEIDRLTRQYSGALERLEPLSRSGDPKTRARAFYQQAQVYFDQEEYDEAARRLSEVFALDARHAKARILEAWVNLRTNKLMDATDVRIGLATAQPVVSPGQPLRITLEDRNLATVGKADLIGIRVWTDSGDEETINLLPFGETRTRFDGELPTRPGAPKKGDKVLQVMGNDKVHYDFSPAFRKAGGIASEPVTMGVASDAEFFASSGEILTAEELADIRLERQIREQMIRAGTLDREEAVGETEPLRHRSTDQLRPGNPIHVRVVDPGSNSGDGKEVVSVKVATSSGETLDEVPLTETEAYSGIFEGTIPTRLSPPSATASSAGEANPPNGAISAADPAPWIGKPSPYRPRFFQVDLQDNVPLGVLSFRDDVPGRRLKRFHVEVSASGQTYERVGGWPGAFTPWQGEPRLELALIPAEIKERIRRQRDPGKSLRDYMESGYLEAGAALQPHPITAPEVRIPPEEYAKVARHLRPGHHPFTIARMSFHLWMPEGQTRVLELSTGGMQGEEVLGVLSVGGTFAPAGKVSRLSHRLAKGLTRVDAYVLAPKGTPPSFSVRMGGEEGMKPIGKEWFAAPGIAREVGLPAAQITAAPEASKFEIRFPERLRGRVVRLLLERFDGDAPALSGLALTEPDGTPVLPVRKEEGMALNVRPGDRITLTYRKQSPLTPGRETYEAILKATFADGQIRFVSVENDASGRATYTPIWRFRPGSRVNVLITDPDADGSGGMDSVPFTVVTSGGKRVELKALETASHSGLFLGAVFPVNGEPKKAGEVPVEPGEDLRVEYFDRENMEPGIPWARTAVAEQAVWAEPQLRIFEVTSEPLTERELARLASQPKGRVSTEERVPPTFGVKASRPPDAGTASSRQATPVLIDAPLLVEVTFPYGVYSRKDTGTLYVQTESGRQAYGKPTEGVFDLNVPGTLRLRNPPGSFPAIRAGDGYRPAVALEGVRKDANPLEQGCYSFLVPMALGPVARQSLVHQTSAPGQLPALTVQGDDRIYVGFPYKDAQGTEQWITGTAQVRADAFFNVMDGRYRQEVSAIHVGETLFFNLIDKSRSRSGEKSRLMIEVKAGEGGPPRAVELVETTENSGVFRGRLRLAHARDGEALPEDLRVDYGSDLTIAYQPTGAAEPIRRTVRVYQGSDGELTAFTKRYRDPETAVQTQFAVAEAYFEMSKKRRELGEEALARQGIAQGKQVLEETLKDFPDTRLKAQADYLLANLALELSDLDADPGRKKRGYLEAITRFSALVAAFPESPYAPKAQYKKALTFEKIGDIDQACEEYVKLSYQYPDNELVAETIARLGQYFHTKGRAIEEKSNKEADPLLAEKLRLEASGLFRTAAEVFSRLAVRFPTHHLAAKTRVLSGQCYMRSDDFEKAAEMLTAVVDHDGTEKEIRAEAMYWLGDCYVKIGSLPPTAASGIPRDPKIAYQSAYQVFKRLTWDYPESLWAKYARGRLTDSTLSEAQP